MGCVVATLRLPMETLSSGWPTAGLLRWRALPGLLVIFQVPLIIDYASHHLSLLGGYRVLAAFALALAIRFFHAAIWWHFRGGLRQGRCGAGGLLPFLLFCLSRSLMEISEYFLHLIQCVHVADVRVILLFFFLFGNFIHCVATFREVLFSNLCAPIQNRERAHVRKLVHLGYWTCFGSLPGPSAGEIRLPPAKVA